MSKKQTSSHINQASHQTVNAVCHASFSALYSSMLYLYLYVQMRELISDIVRCIRCGGAFTHSSLALAHGRNCEDCNVCQHVCVMRDVTWKGQESLPDVNTIADRSAGTALTLSHSSFVALLEITLLARLSAARVVFRN
jgi:hypothetical protein